MEGKSWEDAEDVCRNLEAATHLLLIGTNSPAAYPCGAPSPNGHSPFQQPLPTVLIRYLPWSTSGKIHTEILDGTFVRSVHSCSMVYSIDID